MNEKGHILTEEFKKRASRYLAYMKFQKVKGRNLFDTTEMSSALGFDKLTVSNDLHLLGIYHVNSSISISSGIDIIESFLVVNRLKEAFLICTSKHGKKIINAKELSQQGIKVVAAFDPSPNFDTYEIDGIKVLSTDRITSLSDRMHIQFMIIATEKEQAQQAVNIAIDAGAKAIINTSGVTLALSDEIACINTNGFDNLAEDISKIQALMAPNKH
jgi:redox-sensing transcriptional repressor